MKKPKQTANPSMTQSIRVLMLSYSYIEDDPRVVMEGRIIASLGYMVDVAGVAMGFPPKQAPINGMKISIFPLINSYNPFIIGRGLWNLLRGKIESESSTQRKSNIVSLLFYNLWVLRLWLGRRADIIHCQEHQPLFIAWILARLFRAKLIYDAHENTSLNRAGVGLKGKLAIRAEHFFLPRVDVVITVGERLARFLRDRGARQVVIVGNWKRISDYAVDSNIIAEMRDKLGIPEGTLVVSYIGALDPTRDILPLVEAVSKMPDVHLIIAGRGSLADQIAEVASRNPNIHWLGWLSLDQVPLYTQLSGVIFCCINPGLQQSEFVAPNKLFDAFVAGKAVIARAGLGEMSEILEQIPAGIQLTEVTAESLQDTLRQLQNGNLLQILQNSAKEGGQLYNSSMTEQRLRDLYHDLIK